MKRRHLPYLLAVTLSFPCIANAQWLVLDAANLAQALEQMTAWKQQYQQMEEQKKQLHQQYSAATGSRGLGNFASNPKLQAMVPQDLVTSMNNLQTLGASGLSGQARTIRDQLKIYDCEDRATDSRIACQRLLNAAAQQQALTQAALALTNQRMAQIQALQDKINGTTDPKSIAELQARLQAETTQVGNDANRLALMRALGDEADRAADQAFRERTMKSLSRRNDGSETFRFDPTKR